MQRRKHHRRGRVRNESASSRLGIQAKTALEAHDQWNQREDDDRRGGAWTV
jgi:hypothetical protein